jgi:hypothetical protein
VVGQGPSPFPEGVVSVRFLNRPKKDGAISFLLDGSFSQLKSMIREPDQGVLTKVYSTFWATSPESASPVRDCVSSLVTRVGAHFTFEEVPDPEDLGRLCYSVQVEGDNRQVQAYLLELQFSY